MKEKTTMEFDVLEMMVEPLKKRYPHMNEAEIRMHLSRIAKERAETEQRLEEARRKGN